MSAGYTSVQWNHHKVVYDRCIAAAVILYLASFVLIGRLAWSGRDTISPPILAMRAFGTCAFLMLNVILCIGPLCRFSARFLPLLYNRRHLGVATFLVALCHALLAIGFYHGFGRLNPFVSILSSNTNYRSIEAFPFETLGLIGIVILFFMAATSHDFWLRNLTPTCWKRLHMLVYVAYAALVMHVVLGALQSERSRVYPVVVGLAAALVVTLHIAAGLREARSDSPVSAARGEWVDACSIDDIENGRGKAVCVGRERVGVFRFDGQVSAVANVCAHQGGPLGEGKIVDGCITCPWHGWQYRPRDGRSPPPFTEKVATYRVRLDGRRVLIDPHRLAAGTAVKPARVEEERRA